MVAKSFPELKRFRIAIQFGELDRDTCFFYYLETGRYRITVSDCLRRAPRRVLEGGIAHELSHIVHDSRLGPYQRDLAFQRYARSAAYRMRDERNTELRQIDRGYGPQLLSFVSYAKTLGFRFTREHGLLRAEIASRLRPAYNGESSR
jgi:hypothetical protein